MPQHESATIGSTGGCLQDLGSRLECPGPLALQVCTPGIQGGQANQFQMLCMLFDLETVLQDARPWPNYDTDYRPMVEVAKQEGLPVICANAPRRYVSLAGRSGREALEQLPQEARQWLAPLPYRQPSQVQTGCRFSLHCILCLDTGCRSTKSQKCFGALADMPWG